MTDTDLPLLEERDIRRAAALRAKAAKRVELGPLSYWNPDPCADHAEPDQECSRCGGPLWDHQTRSIAHMFIAKRSLEASVTGAGKTNMALGLCALLKQKGLLTSRAIVICQTPAVLQWAEQAAKFTPKLRVEPIYSGLNRQARVARYAGNWDVLVIGYHMLLQDKAIIHRLEPGLVLVDDVDPLLNYDNKTHKEIVKLCAAADRSVVFNATNIQTRLQQIHAAMEATNGKEIFGSANAFEKRYVQTQRIALRGRDGEPLKTKDGRPVYATKVLGYKNLNEFKTKIAPWVIRNTYDDFGTDVSMPEIMPPENVYLELHPAQRAKYAELQKGIIRLIAEEGTKVKHATALTKITYGQQICAGLPALHEPDGPEASVKLDWIMEKLAGDFEGQKILTFMKNKGMIEAFQARLRKADVGYATIWGNDRDALSREAERKRFWSDPRCRVFMGTAAMERSLNLQNANILVNVDTHLNPARMAQLLGRVRRGGSKHKHVFVFNLFAADTQETKYLDVLKARQAIADFVWDEASELYEALSPLQLLSLIKP